VGTVKAKVPTGHSGEDRSSNCGYGSGFYYNAGP